MDFIWPSLADDQMSKGACNCRVIEPLDCQTIQGKRSHFVIISQSHCGELIRRYKVRYVCRKMDASPTVCMPMGAGVTV